MYSERKRETGMGGDIRELSPEGGWRAQSEPHLVGVNSVAVLVCVDGGQGGGHSKGNQRDGQRVTQNPRQLGQVGEERLGESGERGVQGKDGLGLPGVIGKTETKRVGQDKRRNWV